MDSAHNEQKSPKDNKQCDESNYEMILDALQNEGVYQTFGFADLP